MKLTERYFGEFKSKEDVLREFQIGIEDIGPFLFLAASYETGHYDGFADICIVRPNMEIFIVAESHCSCNGLEGSWRPSQISKEYLVMQQEKGCATSAELAALEFINLNESW